MLQYPEGIPFYSWVFNGDGIRFRPSFWRWIFGERLGRLMLGGWGTALFVSGLLAKAHKKENGFILTLALGMFAYVSVIATANVRHDYYQVPAIPIFAIFMALGIKTLIGSSSNYVNKYVGALAALALITGTYAFGFYEIKGFYWVNKPQIVEAGKEADRILPKNATVIAPYGGDAAFLYQTNRRGYPVVDRPLEEFVENGTKYLISVDPNEGGIKDLSEKCKILKKADSYVIIEMSKECIQK